MFHTGIDWFERATDIRLLEVWDKFRGVTDEKFATKKRHYRENGNLENTPAILNLLVSLRGSHFRGNDVLLNKHLGNFRPQTAYFRYKLRMQRTSPIGTWPTDRRRSSRWILVK